MIKKILLICLACLMLVGCAGQHDRYYQTVDNVITSKKIEATKKAIEEQSYNIRMADQMSKAVTAAAKTKSPIDDIMVPMVYMQMAHDQQMMRLIIQAMGKNDSDLKYIHAPLSWGQNVREAGGTILGIAGMVTGIVNSNNNKELMEHAFDAAGATLNVDGDGNAVNSQSYNSQSSKANTSKVLGDNNSVIPTNSAPEMQYSTDSHDSLMAPEEEE